MMPNPPRRPRRRAGFTLVELLVVITIIVLVSAATLPTVIPALAHRQVSEAARILQAALVGARDAAIRDNAPRGIRLLPDPLFNGSTTTLAYNRFVPIETAGDYSTGMVSVTFPPDLNYTNYVESPFASNSNLHPGLRVDEAVLDKNGAPNERTSWFWNIRIGDKIRFNDAGRYYTVVGPMLNANPELFVNDNPPGQAPRSPSGVAEYLYLVNGQDDNGDGFVDNGWDGFNNNYNLTPGGVSIIDEDSEWVETEQWTGPELATLLVNPAALTSVKYTILRRPTPVPGAREVTLPGGVVVDATTWNATSPNGPERSRLPIDPKTLYVDILINANGQVVPTTEYSSPSASSHLPFYHFWLAERQDVHETTDVWGTGNTNNKSFLLPLPEAFYSGLNPQPSVALEGDRRLLTLFTRTGQLTSNTLENFSMTDINAPFYAAQTGIREAQ